VTSAGVDVAPPFRERVYYGWIVLGVACAAMIGTLPGRTQGLGLITEPLLRDLNIGRVAYAQMNLVATLIGGLFCLGIGRLLDRFGSRVVLTMTALALGVTVLAMSRASGAMAMLVDITLTRGFGQSALSVISLAMVGKWFRRRLTRAMAVYSVVMSIGFMTAFPLVGSLVQSIGWRVAWATIGLGLVFGLAPLAWLLDRSTPEAIGAEVDGGDGPDGAALEHGIATDRAAADRAAADRAAADRGSTDDLATSTTFRAALRTPAFWVFALAASMYGLVASGIGLLNESILIERGFAADVYYRALAITAIAGLAGNLIAGALAGRVSLRMILLAALLVLGGGLIGLAHVSTVAEVMGQAVTMGVGGGFVMVVFFSFWGRAYGRLDLGRIQGAAQVMTVLASAVGPLFLAAWAERTGSYAAAFYLLASMVGVLAVAAALVPVPQGARTA
jgi:MFS family permease